MENKILLGFRIKDGKPIYIDYGHMIISGMTNKTGKTTTIEGITTRSKLKSVIFKTKPSEQVFDEGNFIKPYFKEEFDWEYVASLLEATMKERLKFERSWIIEACKGATSLNQVYEKCKELERTSKRSLEAGVYRTLVAYFEKIMPELEQIKFSEKLVLQNGINIMDLENISESVQSLIIRSVIDEVQKNQPNTIIAIPEAWKFLPESRGNPVKLAAEKLARQGAVRNNFIILDSQDLAGISKIILKQASTYVLGLQLERNEVKHTLDQIPLPKKSKPKEDEIMTLKKGQFIVCTPDMTEKIYVKPAWLSDHEAIKIAMGEMSIDDVKRPEMKRKDDEELFEINDMIQRLDSLEKQMRENNNAVNLKMESIIQKSKELEKKYDELKESLKGKAIEARSASSIELSAQETTLKVINQMPNSVKLSTKIILGKIMYVMIKDLKSEPSGEAEITAAMSEHGWATTHNTMAPSLGRLVREGFLIKDGSPAKYRPPKILEINIEEEKVELA